MAEAIHDLPSILDAVDAVERAVGDFFGSLDADEFVLRVGDAWTAGQHLDHLNIAVSAAARAYTVAPWLLRLRFGRGQGISRTCAALHSEYLDLLGRGGQASGRYIPRAGDTDTDPIVQRTLLLSRWYRVNERFRSGIRRWNEQSLDRTQVKHPLLGRITLRELAFFTILHGHHHVAAAKRRLPRLGENVKNNASRRHSA